MSSVPFTGKKTRCPSCAEKGEDRSADNLALRADGSGYCFKCDISHSKVDLSSPPKSKARVEDVDSLPFGSDPARKISESVSQTYGTRVARSEYDGETVQKVYYPYEGGYKARTIPKKFFVVGEPKGLFWPQDLPEYPSGALVLTEGEEDTLAVAEVLQQCGKDGISASVGNGTSVDRSVMADLETIKKFKKVIVWFDNDDAGETAAQKLCELLAPEVHDVSLVPRDDTCTHKDASSHVQAGDITGAWGRLTSSVKFEPEGVLAGSDADLDYLMEAEPEGYELPFPILQGKLHGLRKGEITTVCAGSGIGKSTVVKEIGYDLVRNKGATVCHIALEDLVKTVQQAYIAMDNNVPWQRLRTQPYSIAREEWERSKDEILSQMYFFRHFGSIQPDNLIKKMEYYIYAKQVDFIILDHLSMVVSGLDVSNERKSIDIIMTKLAELVVRTGVGLVQVVHLKRRDGGTVSFGEGGKPSLSDLRGSASLEQLSWNVLALARDQQADDGSEDLSKVYVLKNRTWGFTGECDTLRFNHITGRMDVANSEISDLEETEDA
ncbi:MAG: DnaB-like helicase C-terminal domain-containing protein [Methanosarcinales archaeon]